MAMKMMEISDEMLRLRGLLMQGQNKAKKTMTEIVDMATALLNKKNDLKVVVFNHNQHRQELLFEEMKRKDLTWCSCCLKLAPEAETELIFVEGRGEFTRCYDKYIGSLDRFSCLERACPACKTNAFNLHGWQKDSEHGYMSMSVNVINERAFFKVFHIEKRQDGFYYREVNSSITWRWLDEKKCRLPELTDNDIDSFCGQLGLPPRLSVKTGYPGVLSNLLSTESQTTDAAPSAAPN